MNSSDDAITLQAFSLARLQLNNSLPDDLKQAVHNVGDAIASGQPGVANEVRALVQQNPCLRDRYDDAYHRLQQLYHQPEHRRSMLTMSMNTSESLTVNWERLVAKLLTADDPKAIAQQVIKARRSRQTVRQVSAIPHEFLNSLQQELVDLDNTELAVLQALERQLLTVEDLAYVVGLPKDKVRIVVQSLWNKGYIDTTKRGLFDRLTSLFSSRSPQPQEVTGSTSFNLTAKGHFRLHPLVRDRRQEGNSL